MLSIKEKRNLRAKTACTQILFASSGLPPCRENYTIYYCKVSKQASKSKFINTFTF